MIYQFQVKSDDSTFILDTARMIWGRASSILSAPSVAAASNSQDNLAQFVFAEEGKLVRIPPPREFLGAVFNMEGRNPKTTGMGAGLSTVSILEISMADAHIYYLDANVELKQDSFMTTPIKVTKRLVFQPRFQKVEKEAV